MFYFVKSPIWLQWLYKDCTWKIENSRNEVFITFDDGPHPEITPFVLDTLKLYNAKATFFCIGKNVNEFPEIYQRIIKDGHAIGNHTQNHINGWKVEYHKYIENVEKASNCISTALFRPPYGRITRKQIVGIKKKLNLQPIMWTVLSGDFDKSCSAQQVFKNVTNNISVGDIIVFHDSFKCGEKLKYALPLVLEFIKKKNWVAMRIEMDNIAKSIR
jgi:peptidoglycan/xylan/chitin deacetylase (PgdA/CDA1 family)